MHCALLTKWSIALAFDVMHGCGPSNEIRHQLQPENTKLMLY